MQKKNNYFELTTAQQRTVLEQTAIKQGLPKQAIEKDLWVTAILQIIFHMPIAATFVFKGGTSLSKVWGLINRFSEDIDLGIDRSIFNYNGDLSKNQVGKLRKKSSLYVRDNLCPQIVNAVKQTPLKDSCQIEVEQDGKGENPYTDPRSIFVNYDSVFKDQIVYIQPKVKIEASARTIIEPYKKATLSSIVEATFPTISTTIAEPLINTAIPEKTFLEKAFLLHELFSVRKNVEAQRKSRHMYDLYMMMKQGIERNALRNGNLWDSIRRSRCMLTPMRSVNYEADIRKNIQLIPPKESLINWKKDYEEMASAMIYGEKPIFEELLESMNWLELLFKKDFNNPYFFQNGSANKGTINDKLVDM